MNINHLKRFLFSFEGRIGRSDYWLKWILPATVAIVVPNGIFFMVAARSFDPAATQQLQPGVGWIIVEWVLLLYSLVILWAHLAVTGRRWHDRDKSGWLTMILLVMIVPWIMTAAVLWSLIVLAIVLWMLVDCGFLKGTDGPNRFGEDPLEAGTAQPATEPQM